MNWFTGKPLTTTAFVVGVDTNGDGDRMDCEDDARIHIWLCIPAWSTRRAVYTGGDEFFRAYLGTGPNGEGLPAEEIDRLLGGYALARARERYAKAMRGMHFYVSLIGPTDEAEPGERIEFTKIEATPPIEEVMARLGMTTAPDQSE